MDKHPIYLDNNATTQMDPRVFEAMKPYFLDYFGNAASGTHSYGWQAESAVREARETIARLIGSNNKESIIFTSGTTESNNLVIKGLFQANASKPFHIITQETEHDCVLKACDYVKSLGANITILPVDGYGLINCDHLKQAINKDTKLVSIMTANNEIGTIQNIVNISQIVHEHTEVLFHTDAAQAVGKIPINVLKDDIDLMSFSAHKIYGPKGIGALYIAPKVPKIVLEPLFSGGGHEFGIRSGTINVPGIIGFAKALELCIEELDYESKRQTELRDYLISQIQNNLDHIHLNGHPTQRLPNNINFTFEFVDSAQLMLKMPKIAVSSGAACASGKTEPSYVIQALGRSINDAKSSVRIGLGRFTTKEDIDIAINEFINAVKKMRENSLEYEMCKSKLDY